MHCLVSIRAFGVFHSEPSVTVDPCSHPMALRIMSDTSLTCLGGVVPCPNTANKWASTTRGCIKASNGTRQQHLLTFKSVYPGGKLHRHRKWHAIASSMKLLTFKPCINQPLMERSIRSQNDSLLYYLCIFYDQVATQWWRHDILMDQRDSAQLIDNTNPPWCEPVLATGQAWVLDNPKV